MTPESIEHSITVKLKEYKDIEAILLKGHLIIEQAINHLIAAYNVDSKRIESMNLMFAKRLELAMALGAAGAFKTQYAQLKEINRIRNKVAHEIFFDNYHEDLKAWVRSVLANESLDLSTEKKYRNHVIDAFSFLSGFIVGFSEALSHIRAEK